MSSSERENKELHCLDLFVNGLKDLMRISQVRITKEGLIFIKDEYKGLLEIRDGRVFVTDEDAILAVSSDED